jgi:GntR family transcriptional regulator, transcriptional repressor for pyruvate dehydrogenase complex
MFILQDERAKEDLAETKWLIEQLCLQLACQRRTEQELAQLEKSIRQKTIGYELFFKWVTAAARNYLLERIWHVLHNFSQTIHDVAAFPDEFYEQMLKAFAKRDVAAVTKNWETYTQHRLSKKR